MIVVAGKNSNRAGEKITNKYTVIVYIFLKFIYCTDVFWLFPGNSQGACYMVQWKNTVYIFQDTFIYVIVLQFQLSLTTVHYVFQSSHNHDCVLYMAWSLCRLLPVSYVSSDVSPC
jgi:hypothetical protein